MLRKLLDQFGKATDLWAILQVLFPSLGGIMIAWSAYIQDLPWHEIIFYATGVAAFLAIVIDRIWTFLNKRSLFGYLRVERTEPILALPDLKKILSQSY